jgi:hypothetical protein
MIAGLDAVGQDRPQAWRRSQAIDRLSRSQIALAAQFLRSIRPPDGEVEIMLHEIARRLEEVVDSCEVRRPLPVASGAIAAVRTPRLG